MQKLVETGLFSQRIADNIQEKGARQIDELKQQMRQLHRQMKTEEMLNTLAMRCLVREKARYRELFAQGLINEWAYRELDHNIDVQLDGIRHHNKMPTAHIETSIGKRLSLFTLEIMEYMPGFQGVIENLRTQWIVRDYSVAWGRYRGAHSVLSQLTRIAGEEIDDQSLAQVQKVFENIEAQVKLQIDEMADQYPEFIEAMQEQLGQRLMLIAEHESVAHAADLGIIQQGIASEILKDQKARIRILAKDNMSACFEIELDELIGKVPIFSTVSPDEYPLIKKYLRPRTVPRGTDIIREGQAGDSMFLIARGIAHVFRKDDSKGDHKEKGESRQVATMYAGDFFGESAMLHQTPRNATAIAATPCSLYELRRVNLDRICENHPELRKMVEAIDAERRKFSTPSTLN